MGRSTSVAVALLVLAAGCRAPTQITLVIYTDLPCTGSTRTVVRVGILGALTAKPWIVDTQRCIEHRVGSLVVIPSNSRDEAVAVEVMTRVSGDPRTCDESSPDTFVGCIAARRALHFVEHSSLDLPIDLYAECIGKVCDPRQTCVKGTCLEATITDPTLCHDEGCRFGKGATGDAGDADGGLDTSPDAPATSTFSSSPSVGSSATPTPPTMTMAADGSTYVVLPFTDKVTLDVAYTSRGATDLALIKLDARGDVVWSRPMGGDDEELPLSVALSNDGGTVYVAGQSGSSNLYVGSATFPTLGGGSVFLAAYRTDGTYVTANRYDGGIDVPYTNRVIVDAAGDVILAATIGDVVSWDGAPHGSTSEDIVVARFSGVDLSVKKLVLFGDPTGRQNVNCIVATPLGPVIVGSFDGTLGPLTSTAGTDAFAIGLDDAFAVRWSVSTVDTGTPPSPTSVLETAFREEATGNLVLAGTTGPDTTKFAGHDVSGTGAFVVTLAADGSWISGAGYATGYGIDFRLDVARSPLGGFSLFATFHGSSGESFTFNGTLPSLLSRGGDDLVLVDFSPSGTVTRQRLFGDGADQTSGRVFVASNGDLIVTGLYLGTLDLGITPPLPLGTGTAPRTFLARLH